MAAAIELASDITEKFSIDFNKRIEEYSTEFASAYKTTKKTGGGSDLYTLVFDKRYPVDLEKINTIKGIDDDGIQEILVLGKVLDNQKSEVLCAILKEPKGEPLADILSKGRVFDESFVMNIFFNSITKSIELLHRSNVTHGSINLDNIYYDTDSRKVTLRENISSFCGFYQPVGYETYERMDCHPAGKSFRDPSADYYALGVLLSALFTSYDPFKTMPDKIVSMIKLENGSYDGIMSLTLLKKDINISSRNENLLKGLLNDKAFDRWDEDKIKKWNRKEISQALVSRVHRQASTPFTFEDTDHLSPKFLAHLIQENWIISKKNIKLPDLCRWIGFISKYPDIDKKLYPMTQSWQSEVIIPDEKLSRILYMLDEGGPIRFKELTFHPDATGTLLSYLLNNQQEEKEGDEEPIDYIKLLETVIDYGVIEGWIGHQEDPKIYKANSMGWSPRKIKFLYRKKDIGFGIKRVLYATNPYLHCQSTALADSLCLNLPALLIKLNEKKLSDEDIEVLSEDIAIFICDQCNVEDTIKIKQLRTFPSIAKMKEVKVLSIFALAQKQVGVTELKQICVWLRKMLQNVAERFNSRNIKSQFEAKLDRATEKGDVSKLFKVITNKKFIRSDLNGYKEARKQYKILNFQILKLKSQTSIDIMAYRLGLRVSVIFSYLICIISVISIMMLHGK